MANYRFFKAPATLMGITATHTGYDTDGCPLISTTQEFSTCFDFAKMHSPFFKNICHQIQFEINNIEAEFTAEIKPLQTIKTNIIIYGTLKGDFIHKKFSLNEFQHFLTTHQLLPENENHTVFQFT